MIDTDKYEGHSEGEWGWGKQGSTDNGDGTITIRPFTQLESKSGVTLLAIHHGYAKQPDFKLIKDAPDLLAEVKRLRQAFLIATGHIGWGNHLGHSELRHALNSVGIDVDSLSWADEEWSEEE